MAKRTRYFTGEIVLGQRIPLAGRTGHEYEATIFVNRESYIPDVYVDLGEEYRGSLYDDREFIGEVMAFLHALGYHGPNFGRAELGMQGDTFVVLEPPKEFDKFITARGWVDLDKRKQAEAAMSGTRLAERDSESRILTRLSDAADRCDFDAFERWEVALVLGVEIELETELPDRSAFEKALKKFDETTYKQYLKARDRLGRCK